MSALNYSKWDHIDVSDDEDEVHPNIDTPSLFKWRHEGRLQREAEMDQEKKGLADTRESLTKQLNDTLKLLQAARDAREEEATSGLNKGKAALEAKIEELEKKEADFHDRVKKLPWNVDSLSHEAKSRTHINKIVEKPKLLTDEEKLQEQRIFLEKYEDEIVKYTFFRKVRESEEYLTSHIYLVCEEAANFLTLHCLELEMEGKHELMKHAAHQTICLQFMLELGREMKIDARDCVRPFFRKMETAEPQYMAGFTDELQAFIGRVTERAKVKLAEAQAEVEAEERAARLGPGGLDPVEVYETLPAEMQQCFESREVGALQDVVAKMNQTDAAYHIKRCVDSGLWVPNANSGEGDGEQFEDVEDASEPVAEAE